MKFRADAFYKNSSFLHSLFHRALASSYECRLEIKFDTQLLSLSFIKSLYVFVQVNF